MLGIIGGVGPKATAKFYLAVIGRVAAKSDGAQPRLLLQNIAMTPRIENAFLKGDVGEGSPELAQVRELLDDAVSFLVHSGAQIMTMPCNTLQDELAAICARRGAAHINMIDATVETLAAASLKRILVLGTSATCRADLYGRRLGKHGITCVYPQRNDQHAIERHIRYALDGSSNPASKLALVGLVQEHARRCDGVLIACTDLTGELAEKKCGLPIFDSLECLAEVAAERARAAGEAPMESFAPIRQLGNSP